MMIFCIDTQFVNDIKNDRQVFEPRQSAYRRGAFGLDNAAAQVIMFRNKLISIEHYYYI